MNTQLLQSVVTLSLEESLERLLAGEVLELRGEGLRRVVRRVREAR